MHDVEVIENPAAAAAALDPIRSRLLAELSGEPASAASVAERVGLTRQKANYHLNLLENHGLIELAEVRMRGGIRERLMRTVAATYVVSPAAIASSGAEPAEVGDRLSARYLVALGGRLVREVADLARRAEAAGRRLPTYSLDTEVSFKSAEDRAAFADELTETVLGLASRYHHDDGRPHRVVIAAHPLVGATGDPDTDQPTTEEERP